MIEKIGGRKFVLGLISFGFLLSIFIFMFFKNWLTVDICMDFMKYMLALSVIYSGSNIADKIIDKFIGKSGGKK